MEVKVIKKVKAVLRS